MSVAEAQNVRVALYDALGREVVVAFDRALAAGQTALLSVDVSRLPAGTYVARATGEQFTATARVTVVR